MSLKRMLGSSLIGFAIISLGLVIGYFRDPRPLSDYEDMALFVFLIKQWYMIPCVACLVFLFCDFLGEVVLLLLGKVDGDGIYIAAERRRPSILIGG